MRKPRQGRRIISSRRFPLQLEVCEPRRLLATFVVTSAADNGAGSLRAAIIGSNTSPAPAGQTNEITFDITGPSTISPNAVLPTITVPTVIDGLTQPNTPIVLNGGVLDVPGSSVPGLDITASDSTVEGLTIDQFPGSAIVLTNGQDDQILDNHIGTDPTGVTSTDSAGQSLGNGGGGLKTSATSGLHVLSNVISGNSLIGLSVMNSANIVIEDNEIGVGNEPGTLDGAIALGNAYEGAAIGYSTGLISSNTISANHGYGLVLSGLADASSTDPAAILVVGNKVGTDSTGRLARGNNGSGIEVVGLSSVTIEDNIVSANTGDGIEEDNAYGTQIAGNTIGTGVEGSESLPNGVDGIAIEEYSQAVSVTGNVIVNNLSDGIGVNDPLLYFQTNTYIAYNYIGTRPLGQNLGYATGLGNLGNGISFDDLSGAEVIGNVIDSNHLSGVAAADSSVLYFEYNFIGFAQNDTTNLGNLGDGVQVMGDGDDMISGNAIGSNGQNGIDLQSALTITIQGNFIGTDALGQAARLGNAGDGVMIDGTNEALSSPNLYFNTIVDNLGNGVEIEGDSLVNLDHDLIGGSLTVAATSRQVASGNGKDGVLVSSKEGQAVLSSNILADNGLDGLQLLGGSSVGSTHDAIIGNLGDGIEFDAGATGNMLLDDLVVDNLATGIFFNLSPNNTLTGVAIENNTGQGLQIIQSPGIVVNGGTITGNKGGDEVSPTV